FMQIGSFDLPCNYSTRLEHGNPDTPPLGGARCACLLLAMPPLLRAHAHLPHPTPSRRFSPAAIARCFDTSVAQRFSVVSPLNT
ncbi:hypothetical protein, partial [Burkholderia diffusa]|uniref:hypothetical protein n=1 Tax=Burkholderia diffusa TaxID=488732 RepID=UPI001E4582A5